MLANMRQHEDQGTHPTRQRQSCSNTNQDGIIRQKVSDPERSNGATSNLLSGNGNIMSQQTGEDCSPKLTDINFNGGH